MTEELGEKAQAGRKFRGVPVPMGKVRAAGEDQGRPARGGDPYHSAAREERFRGC